MKWYKKQMDNLMSNKTESISLNQKEAPTKSSRDSFSAKTMKTRKGTALSPVAASKLSRPKTDVH